MEINLTPNNITYLNPPYLLQMKDAGEKPGIYHVDVILNEEGTGIDIEDTFPVTNVRYKITELVQGPRPAKGDYKDAKPMWARYLCEVVPEPKLDKKSEK